MFLKWSVNYVVKGMNYLFFPPPEYLLLQAILPAYLTQRGFGSQRLDGIVELLKSTSRGLKLRVQAQPRYFDDNRNSWDVGIQLAHFWTEGFFPVKVSKAFSLCEMSSVLNKDGVGVGGSLVEKHPFPCNQFPFT